MSIFLAGVHEIERERRDKIVFLTAGIAVLSLLVNGTTTGPLVRFLKLDRYVGGYVSLAGLNDIPFTCRADRSRSNE